MQALLVAGLLASTGGVALAADPPGPAGPDVCFVLAAGSVGAGAWTALADAIEDVVRSRPELFPEPFVLVSPLAGGRSGDDEAVEGSSDLRIGILADHDASGPGAPDGRCEVGSHRWLARLERDFLVAGAERMLAQAPTTPGIDSRIHLDWHPAESRVRTRLEFAGPLDIPNGECWIDDRLLIEGGQAVSESEQGLRTSPFAEAACGRFFDELDRGGAGEQAVTLLPVDVTLPEGGRLRFHVEDVRVADDAIVIAGSLDG